MCRIINFVHWTKINYDCHFNHQDHDLGPDPGQDVREGGLYPAVREEQGLVHPCASEHQDRQGTLSGYMHMSRKRSPRYFSPYHILMFWSMSNFSEGPIAQTGAPYAKVPGIRVYGMLCLVNGKKRRRKTRLLFGNESDSPTPSFPTVPQHLWNAIQWWQRFSLQSGTLRSL